MSIFQHTVVKRHLASNEEKIREAYKSYTGYFLHAKIQENIRNSKEEQFQEGFLRELFVKVMGYTLNPDPDYNLITEKKNENNAEKADGAILINGEVVGIIELKDRKTLDLKTIEKQAFNYKNHHRNALYVITSNFEKLRFYIGNAIDFIEFNLFTLKENDFALLWLCLAYENIAKGLPKQLRDESISNEDLITKQFYKDYSAFKRALFDNVTANNPQYGKLELFKKTQKLLDRFLFVFFAEDKGLLSPNSTKHLIEQWEKRNKDPYEDYLPLYTRFKRCFNFLNEGYTGKGESIFGYNGGLFKPDAVLEAILIDDEILKENALKLANYNFATDIDVNILGHIFEHSLTEIEEITRSLSSVPYGEGAAESPSKRKKDGVFYTPSYITAYIVENTIGKLCTGKKAALGIDESDYFTDPRRKQKAKKELNDKITAYREWLESLTICDPACGSGAFLNAALVFLIGEHNLINEMSAKIHGDELVYDAKSYILENNLYGVDINEESVEITKLSLWLCTAEPRRKLTSLNNNIKCGNSLISDPEVAGEKAFDWHKEFPHVFEKGGFDVVMGNPPYVFAREKVTSAEKEFYAENYVSAKYQVNTYILFMEKFFRLSKYNGLSGLIVPNSWLMIYSGEDLRKFMIENCTLYKIVSLLGKSFEDASVENIILISENKPCEIDHEIKIVRKDEKTEDFIPLHAKKQIEFSKNKGFEFNVFSDDRSSLLIEKIKNGCKTLDEVCSVKAGLKAYEKGKGTFQQSAQDVKERPYDFNYKYNFDTYKYLKGSDVLRYGISWSGMWLWYGSHLAAPRTFNLFSGEKIIVREITGKYPQCIIATYSNEIYLYNLSNVTIIKREGYDISLKYITAILNSSLMSYYFIKNTAKAERKLFPKIILNDLRLFPIKKVSTEAQQPFILLTDQMQTLNADLQTKHQRFLKRLSDNFNGIKTTKALEHFYEMDFKQFIEALKKQKIPLSLKQQDEWEEYFNAYKLECNTFANQISATDKEIDRMVYELYELTEEEMRIVEGV
ncbi:Type IIS restriction enzyme Eco57I [Bacteroidales bacterium Barb6]|nr:Type IIS restriction enzyme Eco57I [Bacteroidales bacterium Barb6]